MTVPLDRVRNSRVLVLVPTSRDGTLTQALLLSAGIRTEVCSSFEVLVHELWADADAVLISEEAMSAAHIRILRELLTAQPPWSDLPVLVLMRTGSDAGSLGEAVRTLGNVTLLERPLRKVTLLSAIRTAVRARDRQHQIRHQIVEQARAEEALRVADQRKDQFLAMLGHELRNPLAPLLASVHLLEHVEGQDATVREVVGIMDRQIHHLVRLVNDLLEVSRITRGVIDVQREPLDLAQVICAAVETSRPFVEASRHVLSVDLPTDRITIAGDMVRLTQVFANLLTNAAKYTDSGGSIWLRVRVECGRALISVRDNGIGIPQDQLDSVFDMFAQVDRASRRSLGGLGLGLTLVRSLVTIHGGRVEARSAGIDAGSEFVVDLPVLADAPPVVSSPTEPVARLSRRIMVVDDNEDAATTLGTLLSARGATVAVVRSGREALETFASVRPDAVLLDIGMPEMDGYELARRIRARRDGRDVLLIAVTGWGLEGDYQRSRAAGFDHHLVKPAGIDALHHLLVADRSAGDDWQTARADALGDVPVTGDPAGGCEERLAP